MSTQISDTTLAALQRIQTQLQTRGEKRGEALEAAGVEMEALRDGEYANHPTVLLVRAQLGHARGNREETIDAATALRERTSSPAALIAATRALLASNAPLEAARTAARGIQLAPKDATLRTLAVDACARQEETHAEGAAHLDVLLTQVEELPDRERANAHLAAARLAAAIGAEEAALGHLEWVRALAPTHPGITGVERSLEAPKVPTPHTSEAGTPSAERSSVDPSSETPSPEASAETPSSESSAETPSAESPSAESASATPTVIPESAPRAEDAPREAAKRGRGRSAARADKADAPKEAAAAKEGKVRGRAAKRAAAAAAAASAGTAASTDAVAAAETPRSRVLEERAKMPGWCWVLCVGYLLLALGAGLGATQVLDPADLRYDSSLRVVLSAAVLAAVIQVVLAREALRGSVLSRVTIVLTGLLLVGVQVINTAASEGVYQIVNAVVGGYSVLLVVLLSSRWFTLTRGVRVSKVLLVAIGISALIASLSAGLVFARAPEIYRELGAGALSLVEEEPEAPQSGNVRPARPVPSVPLEDEELRAFLPQPADLAALGGVDEGAPAGEALKNLVVADRTRAACYGSDVLRGPQSAAGNRVVVDEGALSYATVESRARELRLAEGPAVLAQLAELRHATCSREGEIAALRRTAPGLPTPTASEVAIEQSPTEVTTRTTFTFPTPTPLNVDVLTQYALVTEGDHLVLTEVRVVAVNYPASSLGAVHASAGV